MLKKRVDHVLVRNHRDDPEMIELYTIRGEKTIIWGCVHSDMLESLHGRITQTDLDNGDYKLVISYSYYINNATKINKGG